MLIFDFDGVLIDSLDEVVLTAYNAATDSLLTSMAEVPTDLVQMFKNNRFHVQPIGDAMALMNWCLENCQKDSQKILTREAYRVIIRSADVPLTGRTSRIYAYRRRFIEKDTVRWLALHQTYQPLWNELIRHKNHPFVILTNKNHDATSRLCRHFGLDMDPQDIYSGDNGVTKIANMGRIQARFGQKSYSFIDDSLKNLKELDHHFNQGKKVLSLALAAWGYIGAEDARQAAEFGYPAFQQNDVVQILPTL